MKRPVLLIIILSSLTYCFSQDVFTLQQCIDYALKNHKNIKVAANDVGVAHARKMEGQSAYLPQVYAQAKWDDNLKYKQPLYRPTPLDRVHRNKEYSSAISLLLLSGWSWIICFLTIPTYRG